MKVKLNIEELKARAKRDGMLRQCSTISHNTLLSLCEALSEASEVIAFYDEWEKKSETAYGKHYNRAEINMNYPAPSKARGWLEKWEAKE